MPQNPIPAYAYGQNPSLVPKLLQCDADGYVIPSGTTDSLLAVPAPDSTANAFERDVIGNKADAAVGAVGATASLMAYVKELLTLQLAGGVVNSIATGAAVISNNLALFTVTGGPVQILSLVSICQTANDATASTLQYESTGTLGATTQTISGASAALTSAAAGESVVLQGTALSTAPVLNANGAGIQAVPASIIVPAGSIKAVVGVGSTTGTWKHFLRYAPLAPGATVVAAF